jgi:hypothetical protein
MPRISAEERSMSMYRAGPVPPAPPRGMSAPARRIWRDIVASKPPGWFDAGSLGLLERHAKMMARAGEVERKLDAVEVGSQEYRELGVLLTKFVSSSVTTARQLRLTVQAVIERQSLLLDEKGVTAAGHKDRLLGGQAVYGVVTDRAA